ncbi:MAG: hypothetical protein ACP5K8_08860 [Nitrososphaeria archaeon]
MKGMFRHSLFIAGIEWIFVLLLATCVSYLWESGSHLGLWLKFVCC